MSPYSTADLSAFYGVKKGPTTYVVVVVRPHGAGRLQAVEIGIRNEGVAQLKASAMRAQLKQGGMHEVVLVLATVEFNELLRRIHEEQWNTEW
jgi:hypothetical protein